MGPGLGACPPASELPAHRRVGRDRPAQADALGTWSAPVALAGHAWLVAVADAPRVTVTGTGYAP